MSAIRNCQRFAGKKCLHIKVISVKIPEILQQINKYKFVEIEIQKMCHLNTQIIPILIGTPAGEPGLIEMQNIVLRVFLTS